MVVFPWVSIFFQNQKGNFLMKRWPGELFLSPGSKELEIKIRPVLTGSNYKNAGAHGHYFFIFFLGGEGLFFLFRSDRHA